MQELYQWQALPHFNTSNVTIQQREECVRASKAVHFNTSNVTIQLYYDGVYDIVTNAFQYI